MNLRARSSESPDRPRLSQESICNSWSASLGHCSYGRVCSCPISGLGALASPIRAERKPVSCC
jgi:hypothetical protein